MKGVKLAEIALILGCSPAAVSLIKNGRYGEVARESYLPARYAALERLIERVRGQVSIERVCYECPRQDCTGCRVAEMTEGH